MRKIPSGWPYRNKPGQSSLEQEMLLRIKAAGLPLPEQEYKFSSSRRWRFDFAWVEQKIAVECEGGIFSGGRHTRGKGFEGDAHKYNSATCLGWKVLRYTRGMMHGAIADITFLLHIAQAEDNQARLK